MTYIHVCVHVHYMYHVHMTYMSCMCGHMYSSLPLCVVQYLYPVLLVWYDSYTSLTACKPLL